MTRRSGNGQVAGHQDGIEGRAVPAREVAPPAPHRAEPGPRVKSKGRGVVGGDIEEGLRRPVREALRSRLDETPLDSLEVDGHSVKFDAAPFEVVTVLLR